MVDGFWLLVVQDSFARNLCLRRPFLFFLTTSTLCTLLSNTGHGKIPEQYDTSIPFYALRSSTSDSALVQACMCQQAMSIGKREQLEPWFQFLPLCKQTPSETTQGRHGFLISGFGTCLHITPVAQNTARERLAIRHLMLFPALTA